MILQLNRCDFTSLTKFLHEFFFADCLWDELNEKVRPELFSHGLSDWISHVGYLLLSIDVRADEQRLVTDLHLQVGCFESTSGISMVTVAHKTGSVFLGLHLC